jgi:hypothetical protein
LPLPPEPASKKPRKSPAAQDQETANTINTVRARLLSIQGNGEAVARLEPRGYGAAGLTEGLGRVDTAQAKFDVRQQAMSAEDSAAACFKTIESEARAGYKDFTTIAAKVLADAPAARNAIVIAARELRDQDKFRTNVEAAYQAALKDTAALAKLGKRGYDQAGVQAELAKLTAMSQANADYAAAQQAAKLALDEREAAYKALKAWWGEFYATAQVAFQGRSDLLGLLDA